VGGREEAAMQVFKAVLITLIVLTVVWLLVVIPVS